MKTLEIRNCLANAADNAKSDVSQDLVFAVELFDLNSLNPIAIGDWNILHKVKGFNDKLIEDYTMERLENKLNKLGVKTYFSSTHAFHEGKIVPITSLPIEL